MHTEKTEGIVLRSQDYQERHRIITLFTPAGLLSLIVKSISRKNARLLALTSVFSHAEYLLRPSSNSLHTFADGTLIDEHLPLRQKLSSIQAAATLTQTILSTQLPEKPAPALFLLYKTYLKQIPIFEDPSPLLSSFLLKLLSHEGLLSLTPQCSHCPDSPATQIDQGESLCAKHSAPHTFTAEEWNQLLELHYARQFSDLRTLILPLGLSEKISSLLTSQFPSSFSERQKLNS